MMIIIDNFAPIVPKLEPEVHENTGKKTSNKSEYWTVFEIVYCNVCSFGTTFGGLCVIYTWYNSTTSYNPISSSLQDSQILQINTQLANNFELLELQNVNNMSLDNSFSTIESLYERIQQKRNITSLDSCFFVSNTNLDLTQDTLTSANNFITEYNSQSASSQELINSIYINVVLNQILYNNFVQTYQQMEGWNYKSSMIAKLLDLIYDAQINGLYSSSKPVALQNTILHGSKPITISKSDSLLSTSFKQVIESSRTLNSNKTITLSRNLVYDSPIFLSWNSLYPLSTYDAKVSQYYSAFKNGDLITNVVIQDTTTGKFPILENDFRTTRFIKQVALQNQDGLIVQDSLDLDSTYVYSDQNGLIVLQNKGFVPRFLTFYYLSSNNLSPNMLVVEKYITPSFTDSSLKNTNIVFSLQSKSFYKYSDLPKDNLNRACFRDNNNNFLIYFNNQMNQIGCLSFINERSEEKPFTLIKTLLSNNTGCSLTYPTPAATLKYQNMKYQVQNNVLTRNSTSIDDIYSILLTAM